MIGVHIIFKQIFALSTNEDFTQLGMAERTVWQALLVGVGTALLRWRPALRIAGMALVGAGLAHFIIFTFLLHNPLWTAQAVGPWPIMNWLWPAYAIAGFGAWSLFNQSEGAVQKKLRWMGDAAIMILIVLCALSELRHSFAGTLLTSTSMSQTEDLLRSLTGIVLALGFLWWGSRTGQRSWRIGSLLLMVLAVFKVFLVDAAGLAGLLRVASFVALGISLIGISVIYSKLLLSRSKREQE